MCGGSWTLDAGNAAAVSFQGEQWVQRLLCIWQPGGYSMPLTAFLQGGCLATQGGPFWGFLAQVTDTAC